MNNKQKLFIIIITVAVITCLVIGTTFAYWSWSTNSAQSTSVTFTVANDFSCSADGGGNITSSSIQLIPASCNNQNYAIKRTITVNTTNDRLLSLDMWLNVNSIATELLNSNNFKYTIVPHGMDCNDGVHKSFNGNVLNNKVMLYEDLTRPGTSSTIYDLYIWLDKAETNKNTQDKTFNLSLGGECTDQITTRQQTASDAMFDTGTNVNIKMKNLAGDDTSENGRSTNDMNITAIKYSNIPPVINQMTNDNIVSVSTVPIYMWYENETIYWWSEDSTPALNIDASMMFVRMCQLSDISGVSDFDTSTTTDFHNILSGLSGCTGIITDLTPLTNWNTSNAVNVSALLQLQTSLTTLHGLDNWNVSNVINIHNIFFGSPDNPMILTDISALSNWDTSSIEDMSFTFQYNYLLSNIISLANWNISNATNLRGFFAGCSSITDISALSNWDTRNVTTIRAMFQRTSITSVDALSEWNTSNVDSMNYLFNNTPSLLDISGLTNWDTSNVTDMTAMFSGTSLTNLQALGGWNVSSVTTMQAMFYTISTLTDASAINNWNIDSSDNFTEMFKDTPVHPTFTSVSGTWDSNGTFIPS